MRKPHLHCITPHPFSSPQTCPHSPHRASSSHHLLQSSSSSPLSPSPSRRSTWRVEWAFVRTSTSSNGPAIARTPSFTSSFHARTGRDLPSSVLQFPSLCTPSSQRSSYVVSFPENPRLIFPPLCIDISCSSYETQLHPDQPDERGPERFGRKRHYMGFSPKEYPAPAEPDSE